MPEGEGATSFPSLNLKVQPKQNSLLTWPNFISRDEIDPKVTHLAEVISGEETKKYGINIWIKAGSGVDDDDSQDPDYKEVSS